MWLGLLQEHHVTEKKEEQPAAINAFEIISMSRGLNLENLFDPEQVLCVLSTFVFWHVLYLYSDDKILFVLYLQIRNLREKQG